MAERHLAAELGIGFIAPQAINQAIENRVAMNTGCTEFERIP